MTDYPNNIPAKLEIIKASEITPKEVRWLWYPYIPFGKVTLLQGDPGDGKSKLMLSLAALLSKGAPLPFDDEDEQGEPMTVIYQTTEDDADDTVVPRFNSAGGDGDRLIFIKEDEKSLTFGDDRIREAVEKYNAKLLILDPMSSYIGDTCSMNNANETRAEFNHLIAVAKDTGCAIVIIAHMNKAKDTSPLYRTNGSIDIAGAARSILAVTRTANKQNPAERYLVQVKSNLAPMGSAILFEVADKGVNFLDELELSAEDAFSASAPRMGRPNAREEAATDFIRSLLAGGRRLASDCERFFYQMLAKCGKHDSYYSSFFYCVGISEDTRNHVDRMFDFKERLIKPGALHEGWQTGGSARLTRLAFNLWNGYVEKGEESLSTPYEMFDCGYAPYFYEAIRIKYPEYCRDLLQVSKKETNHER